MSKRFFIISIALLILFSVSSFAEEEKKKLSGPIVVTSESLTADNRAHTALFETNVVAKTPNMTMYADKMLVFYNEKGGDVTKIESTGNVKVIKNNRIITSGKAVYFSDGEKIVFTEGPMATNGENVVTGSVITYYSREDRSVVEKSKVYLKGEKEK